MKLKYYLRGLGIGIIVTTIVLTISNATGGKSMSDEDVIKRAEALGMVMEEDASGSRLKDQMQDTQEETAATEADTQEDTTAAEADTQDVGQTADDTQTTDDAQATDESTDGQITDGQEADAQTQEETPAENQEAGAQSYMLVVNAGVVCRQICDELQDNGVIDNSEELRKYLGDNGYAKQISPGNYEIPYGASFEEIAQILITRQ
mgnify:FL=1